MYTPLGPSVLCLRPHRTILAITCPILRIQQTIGQSHAFPKE